MLLLTISGLFNQVYLINALQMVKIVFEISLGLLGCSWMAHHIKPVPKSVSA